MNESTKIKNFKLNILKNILIIPIMKNKTANFFNSFFIFGKTLFNKSHIPIMKFKIVKINPRKIIIVM
jgi:hypothetical protein